MGIEAMQCYSLVARDGNELLSICVLFYLASALMTVVIRNIKTIY